MFRYVANSNSHREGAFFSHARGISRLIRFSIDFGSNDSLMVELACINVSYFHACQRLLQSDWIFDWSDAFWWINELGWMEECFIA